MIPPFLNHLQSVQGLIIPPRQFAFPRMRRFHFEEQQCKSLLLTSMLVLGRLFPYQYKTIKFE